MRWFDEAKEFGCRCRRRDCDAPKALDPQWGDMLDNLRDRVGRPIVIASGLRCAHWNTVQGGAPNSQHLTGRAVDIRCTDPTERWILLAAILMRPSEEAPFVEVAPHHVHWDLDFRTPDKSPMLILGPG